MSDVSYLLLVWFPAALIFSPRLFAHLFLLLMPGICIFNQSDYSHGSAKSFSSSDLRILRTSRLDKSKVLEQMLILNSRNPISETVQSNLTDETLNNENNLTVLSSNSILYSSSSTSTLNYSTSTSILNSLPPTSILNTLPQTAILNRLTPTFILNSSTQSSISNLPTPFSILSLLTPTSNMNASNPTSILNASNPLSILNESNPTSILNESNPTSILNNSSPSTTPEESKSRQKRGLWDLPWFEQWKQTTIQEILRRINKRNLVTYTLSRDTIAFLMINGCWLLLYALFWRGNSGLQLLIDPFELTANDRLVSLEVFEDQVDLHSIINFFMTPTTVARNIGISTSIFLITVFLWLAPTLLYKLFPAQTANERMSEEDEYFENLSRAQERLEEEMERTGGLIEVYRSTTIQDIYNRVLCPTCIARVLFINSLVVSFLLQFLYSNLLNLFVSIA
ncbi:uncharacterized protein LOC111709339, partial [Eurytemora carolleeae]|uniref:uncharacterized protein LOC111709339 n=1 Tax=Eurytemora carolleeae TaxID=1294199 RepID=UPI000C7835C5